MIGLDHFGASAPAGTIFEKFGFTAERVTDTGRRVVRDGLHGRIPTVDGGHFGHMGGHPTLDAGEAGVGRTESSDPDTARSVSGGSGRHTGGRIASRD